MPEMLSREAAATHARLTESWLAQGAKLEIFSIALCVLAAAILLLNRTTPAVTVGLVCLLISGLPGKYYAMRVAFDRRLFLHWAERWANEASADPVADMAQLDESLSSSGLRSGGPLPLRSLQDRQRGAFGLFRKQLLVFLLQWLALLVTALAAQWTV